MSYKTKKILCTILLEEDCKIKDQIWMTLMIFTQTKPFPQRSRITTGHPLKMCINKIMVRVSKDKE